MSSEQEHGFGELRSLLQQPPSAALWGRLCELLDAPEWDEAAERWLPYAADHLDREWPDALREWPERWWLRVRQPAAVMLVRAFSPGSLNERQVARLVETIPACGVSLREVRLHLDGRSERGPVERLGALLGPTARRVELRASHASGALLSGLLAEEAAVEVLRIEGTLDQSGALLALLLEGEALPSLRSLTLDYNSAEAHWLAAALPRCGLAGQLEVLALRGARLQAAGAKAMARHWWERLESLSLVDAGIDGDALAAVLAQTPALHTLDVSQNALGDDPARWFERAPALRLRCVDVRRTAYDAQTSVSWRDTPWTGHEDAQLARLLALPQVEALRVLSLREARLEALTAQRLIDRFSGQLEALDLSYIGGPALWARLEGTRWPALRSLTVTDSSTETCEVLASMELPALTRLHIDAFNGMSVSSAALIEGASWRGQLVSYMPPRIKG
jgi:hypothetical protein